MQLANAAMRPQGGGLGYLKPDVNPLRGAPVTGESQITRRAADVPRVGAMSKRSRDNGIATAVRALSENANADFMMIRRDGFPMQPVVSPAELRKVPDNRNMEDAAFLLALSNNTDFGKDELGLLSNTGVTSLVYVLPNGSVVRMDRTRPLSVGERRKLGKTVSSAESIDNSKNPLARLEAVVANSDGAISLETDFAGIKNPESPVPSGPDKGKPRWAQEAFKGGKRKPSTQVPSAPMPKAPQQGESRDISNLEGAIEHINKGGNLSEIDPTILMEAVRRSKVYRQKKLNARQTLFTRTDGGVGFTEVTGGQKFEHLGAHASGAIQEHLGMVAPKVRLVDSGDSRPYLVQDSASLLKDGKVQVGGRLDDVSAQDRMRLLASDYLLDVRGRNPSSVSRVTNADGTRLVSTVNAPSAFVGLSANELEKRRNLDFGDFASSDGKVLADSLSRSPEEVRQQALDILESLIQRARAFKWDDYISKLKVDGQLSDAEERHMKIVQSLFTQRLERLAQSREMLSTVIGMKK